MKKINFAWLLTITPLIPLTVAAKCTTTKSADPSKPDPDKMYKQEYEYKSVEYGSTERFNENVNKEAAKGWRVVSVIYRNNRWETFIVTYERKLI